ncbi:MAG: MFS transporter [Bacteroidia bacterium]
MSKIPALQVLKNISYRYFLTTRICLTLALQMQAVIIGWHIYKLTQDPLSLGLIGLAEAIPAISIALYAGHIADIYNKKKILIFALTALAICSVCLLLTVSIQNLTNKQVVWLMYLFILLSGFARGFYSPTAFSIIPQLIERSLLTNASTLNSTSWQFAAVIGPALGGVFYAWLGIKASFIIILFFLLLALFCISKIKLLFEPKTLNHEGIIFRLKEGIAFVFNNKIMLSAISLDLFAVLFGGAVALLPIFANEILKVGAEGLGMLRAAPSFGAVITMLFLSAGRNIKKPGKVLIKVVGAFGLCMIGFALSTNFYLSLLFLFLSGAFDSVSVVIRGNILQLITPDEMRGRVSAVNTMFIGSSNEIGAFESGLAAKLLGTVPSVVFGGFVTLLVVGITQIKAKQLKHYEFP